MQSTYRDEVRGMVVENPLLSGAVIAAGVVAAANLANMLLKPWTEKRSNQINAARLEMEQEAAHRQGDTQLFDIEAKRREELRQEFYREQERAELAEKDAAELRRQLIIWQGRCEFHGRQCQIGQNGQIPLSEQQPGQFGIIQLNPLPLPPKDSTKNP